MVIAAGKFKAECLKLLDRVHESHEEIVISKRGRPVCKLVPVGGAPQKGLYGYMAGTVVKQGDVVSPTGEVWDAEN